MIDERESRQNGGASLLLAGFLLVFEETLSSGWVGTVAGTLMCLLVVVFVTPRFRKALGLN